MTTMVSRERPQVEEQREAWLRMLRTACNTVGQPPARTITAMTVSARFDGLTSTKRDDFLALAKLIGGEYGLQVELEDTGTHLEARFSCEAPVLVAPAHASELSFIRSLHRRLVQE